jgi:DNA-binding NarL/FixJ family response regulator
MKTLVEKPLPPSTHEGRGVRVLIVDDTPQVRHDLRQLLELSGLVEVVGEAADGREAAGLASQLSPEVVVMDLEMPGMNGYEATQRIKAEETAARVVILSVHARAEEMERAREAGADAFVTKGASYEVLLNAILAKDDPSNSLPSKKGEDA